MTKTTGLHDLILRIARGDRNACAEFNDQVHEWLIQRLASEFGSDFDEGDIIEIVSHAILNMFLHAREYRGKNGDGSAWTWAYQIARNQALKWIKTRTREVDFPHTSDGSEINEEKLYRMVQRYNPVQIPVAVEDQVIERLFRQKAEEILRKLSDRERLILYLHFEMEWTFKQIAEYLKVKPPRVTQIMQKIQRICIEEMARSG